MQTLPTLPPCTDRAAYRIEIYSPADGASFGSLDGSTYACVEHVQGVMSALDAAGFNPFRCQLPPDVERVCGYTFVFQTGTLGGTR